MPRDLLQSVDEHVRQVNRLDHAEVVVGPFRAYLHRTLPDPWFSYATPFAALGSSDAVYNEIETLRGVFRAHGRTLRFEFTASLWPGLAALLDQVGLHPEGHHPLMLCAPHDLLPYDAPGVDVRFITEADDLGAYQSLKGQAFGSVPRPATEQQVNDLRSQLQAGMCYALAALDDVACGFGGYTPVGGVCELVAIATLPAMRRRGVAGTLSSFLARDHFTHGGELAWLTAGDATAEAVYRRIGFHTAGVRLNYTE